MEIQLCYSDIHDMQRKLFDEENTLADSLSAEYSTLLYQGMILAGYQAKQELVNSDTHI